MDNPSHLCLSTALVVIVLLAVLPCSVAVGPGYTTHRGSRSAHRSPSCPPLYYSNKEAQLPYCDDAAVPRSHPLTALESISHRSLLLVSSMDGKISAVEPKTGKTLWSRDTGPGPLLSGTVSSIELSGRGDWLRLIPSLDGMLYKYDGKTVEPVPMTAETLLQSSYKLGDDVVITGGRESRSYGIRIDTGEVRYECTMDGCTRFGGEGNASDLGEGVVLLVKRENQAVRAVEPRSGSEMWNFSVGEHQVSIVEGVGRSCHGGTERRNLECIEEGCFGHEDDVWEDGSVVLKAIVPEGLLLALDSVTNAVVWSVKFEAPIANAWYVKGGQIHNLDVFNWNDILGSQQLVDGDDDEGPFQDSGPALYIGSHNQQLYIQHSRSMKLKIAGAAGRYLLYSDLAMPRLEWNPDVIVQSTAADSSDSHRIDGGFETQVPLLPLSERSSRSTAVVFPRGGGGDGSNLLHNRGYYLYDNVLGDSNLGNESVCRLHEAPAEAEAETLNQIVIASLWYRWKEILFVGIILAMFLNVIAFSFLWKRMKRKLLLETSNTQPIQIIQPAAVASDIGDAGATENPSQEYSSSLPITTTEFRSRFLEDFESIRCLGKGGFGVVIEARNKIDECSYAIKRICLPYREEAREKVMREVKALAKLDHPGIVRYYNSWLESPPPSGWHEEQDAVWDCSDVHSVTSPSPGSPVLKRQQTTAARTRGWDINLLKPFDPLHSSSDGSFGFVPKHWDDERNDNNNVTNLSEDSSSFGIVFNDGDCTRPSGKPKNSSIPFQRHRYHSSGIGTDSVCTGRGRSADADATARVEDHHSGKRRDKGCGILPRPNDLDVHSEQQLGVSARPPKLYLYIQMQLCRKETLKDWLCANASNRTRYEVLDIFDQIVSAVDYVHTHGLMHRDLKPSNIFFSMDGTIKVGDFGLVTALTENEAAHTPAGRKDSSTSTLGKHTDQVGTQLYMSPEQMSGLPYSHKVDIYSLGLIFFELLVPFQTQMERCNVLLNVKNHVFPEDFQNNQQEECDFVRRMLSVDPNGRPSAAEIKRHPLFREFQPQPETIVREQFRRRTMSQRLSSSSSSDETCCTDAKALESRFKTS